MEEPESSTPDLPALVAEFVPLNRRRVRGNPPLSVAELERWTELRELLEYEFGTANPPLAGTRRRALRVPTHLKVRTSGRGDAVSNLRDVSEGGAFIETSEIAGAGHSPQAGDRPREWRAPAAARCRGEVGSRDRQHGRPRGRGRRVRERRGRRFRRPREHRRPRARFGGPRRLLSRSPGLHPGSRGPRVAFRLRPRVS